MVNELEEDVRAWYKSHAWFEVRVWNDARALETDDVVQKLKDCLRASALDDPENRYSYLSREMGLRDELSIRYDIGELKTQERIHRVRAELEGAHMKAVQVALRLVQRMSVDEIVDITDLERPFVEIIAEQYGSVQGLALEV